MRPPSTLTVPFRSPLEADMARRSLAPHAQRHGGVVHKELAVNGSALAVSVLEEDAGRGGGGGGRCPGGRCVLECPRRGGRGGARWPAPPPHLSPATSFAFCLSFSRWTAEDPVFFRISINSFLDQLSLVIRNIRGFGTPPPRSLGPGKRS